MYLRVSILILIEHLVISFSMFLSEDQQSLKSIPFWKI